MANPVISGFVRFPNPLYSHSSSGQTIGRETNLKESEKFMLEKKEIQYKDLRNRCGNTTGWLARTSCRLGQNSPDLKQSAESWHKFLSRCDALSKDYCFSLKQTKPENPPEQTWKLDIFYIHGPCYHANWHKKLNVCKIGVQYRRIGMIKREVVSSSFLTLWWFFNGFCTQGIPAMSAQY